MVVRPVIPALPHIDMHIALAYKPQSASELVPLFVDVVRDVVAKHSRPKPMRLASVDLQTRRAGAIGTRPFPYLSYPPYLPS